MLSNTAALVVAISRGCLALQGFCRHCLEAGSPAPSSRSFILNEATSKPCTGWVFIREWRKVAKAEGIPDEVRNMDVRASAITEGDGAGADLDSLTTVAAHVTASTTARYVRGAVGKSRAVANLRLKHWASQNEA